MKLALTRASIWLSFAVSAVLIFWVADGIADMERQPGYAGHYYEYLTEGFVHGHTFMAIAPAKELAALKDPYDPAQNRPYRLADASYYRGRYYLYFGPTPAVVLMLPWRVITGSEMPERLAAAVFAVAALAGLGLLLLEIRARHFPALSGWGLAAIVFLAMHAAWLPVTLRRAGFWELPHAAALACLWWTFYFLWRLQARPGSVAWAAAVGVGLVLLLGSRPTFLFAATFLVLLALVGTREEGEASRAGLRSRLLALGLPLAAGGTALLAYNLERFGRPFEFGQSYQLLNSAGELHHSWFRLDYVRFNFWVYFLSVPQISPYFPFVKAVWPASLPPGYIMPEEMQGGLLAMPVHLAGVFAVAWIWRRRAAPGMRPLALTVAAGVATSLFATGILLCWEGATSRYLTEISGGWTLASCVGLMAVLEPKSGRTAAAGRLARSLAMASMVWTVCFVWMASFEHGGLFRQTNPRAYAALARALDYPSQEWARARGQRFGPLEVTVQLTPYCRPETVPLLSTGRLNAKSQLILSRLDATHVRLSLLENETSLVTLQLVPDRVSELKIKVEAPWLYPPVEHPYWDAVADPAERTDREERFGLTVGPSSSVGFATGAYDATDFDPSVPSNGSSSVRIEGFRRLSAHTR
jgi:hypothetical protein